MVLNENLITHKIHIHTFSFHPCFYKMDLNNNKWDLELNQNYVFLIEQMLKIAIIANQLSDSHNISTTRNIIF